MSSGPKKRRHLPAQSSARLVSGLAIEVVAKLVAGATSADRQPRKGIVEKLFAAVISGDPAALAALQPELRRARVTAPMLADVYIPEVARKLGQGWLDDRLSFTDVSVGTARLQAMLREIGVEWWADERVEGQGATVLVIVPAGEQHTLGAMVLISQLRRRGVSVCLRFAPEDIELRALLLGRLFDAVLITMSSHDKVAAVSRLVRTIRHTSPRPMFVALGGAGVQPPGDLQGRTGVDLVTNDFELVLKRVRLTGAPLNLLETA